MIFKEETEIFFLAGCGKCARCFTGRPRRFCAISAVDFLLHVSIKSHDVIGIHLFVQKNLNQKKFKRMSLRSKT
jgi:hypothetical protein